MTVVIFIMLQNIYTSNKSCSFELSIKEKKLYDLLKNIKQHNYFQLRFLKDHVTLKTGVVAAKN